MMLRRILLAVTCALVALVAMTVVLATANHPAPRVLGSRPSPPGANGYVVQLEAGIQAVQSCEAGQLSGYGPNGAICATATLTGTAGFTQPSDYCGPSPYTSFFMPLTSVEGLVVGESISIIDGNGNGGWYQIVSLADGGVTGCLLVETQDSGSAVGTGAPLTVSKPPRYVPADGFTILQWTLDDFGSTWANTGNFGALDLTKPAQFAGNAIVSNIPSIVQGPDLHLDSIWFPGDGGISTGGPTDAGEAATLATGITLSALVMPVECNGNTAIIAAKDYYGDGGWNTPYVGPALTLSGAVSSNGTCAWEAAITTGGTQRTITSSFGEGLTMNAWNFVALTYCNGTLLGYHNQTALKTSAVPDAAVDYGTHGQWEIGGETLHAGQGFHGQISYLRYESVCRTANYLGALATLELGVHP